MKQLLHGNRITVSARMTAIILCLVMLVGVAAYAAVINPVGGSKITIAKADNTGNLPEITVLGTKVMTGEKETEYFEVGIAVQTRIKDVAGTIHDDTFRSLGMALQYDPTILVPVTWEEEEPTEDSPGGSIKVELGEKLWGTQLPVKSADMISTAAALTDESGLLYIWAESAIPQELYKEILDEETGAGTGEYGPVQILAIRFTYADGYIVDDDDEDGGGDPLAGRSNGENGSEIASGSMFSPEDVLTGESVSLLSVNNILDDFVDAVKFADDDKAADSPAGQSVWYAGDSEYYWTADVNNTQGIIIDVDPAASDGKLSNLLAKPTFKAEEGPTFFQGGGGGMNLSDVAVIAFYDWDDTFLGVTAISRLAEEEVVKEQIDNFVASRFQGYDANEHTSLVKNIPVDPDLMWDHSADTVDIETYPLTSKKGYNFAGWIEVDPTAISDTFTAYANVEAFDAAEPFTAAMPESGEWGTMYLKAGYVGNGELDKYITNFAARYYYTFSKFSFGSIDLDNYTMDVVVSRRNGEGYGATCLRKPTLRVTYTVNGVTMYIKSEMQGGDAETVTLVLPLAATSFIMAVVDESSATTYVNADFKSEPVTMSPYSTGSIPGSGDGYVREGLTTFVNGQAAQNIDSICDLGTYITGWNSAIGVNHWTPLGLDDYVTAVGGQNSTVANNVTNNRNIARNRILIYKAAMGNRALTHSEIIAAVSLNTGNYLANTANAAHMTPRVQTMMIAEQRKGSGLAGTEIVMLLEYIFTNLGGASPSRAMTVSEIESCLGL